MTKRYVIAAVLLIVSAVLACAVRTVARAQDAANRKMCAAQMISLGHGMLMYSFENRGHYPPGLTELMVTQDIGSLAFVCPSSGDTQARGESIEELAGNLKGEHLSYVYAGSGMTKETLSSEVVLLYEKPTNHGDGRINVLFGDLHVELFGEAVSKQIVLELEAGHNPPMTTQGPAAGQGRRIEKFDEVPDDNYYHPR